jgi:hypothetical protein
MLFTKQKILVWVSVFLLMLAACTPLMADEGLRWDLGWESTVFTQGVTARLSQGSLSLNVAAHYSFIGAIMERILAVEDEDSFLGIFRIGLVSASITKSYPVGKKDMRISVGPKMIGLTAGLQRFMLGSAGVDLVFEFWNKNQKEGMLISGFVPIILLGDDIGFDNGFAWAWETFGFAISPSVGYFWTY